MNKILLVEDDPAFADMVRKALVMFSYEVVLARDGKEALRLFDSATMLVVITDLLMPDMDGMQLIVKLQQRDPSVRIIAMSGGGLGKPETYLPMAERLGAVKTLAKPFAITELIAAIEECLDES